VALEKATERLDGKTVQSRKAIQGQMDQMQLQIQAILACLEAKQPSQEHPADLLQQMHRHQLEAEADRREQTQLLLQRLDFAEQETTEMKRMLAQAEDHRQLLQSQLETPHSTGRLRSEDLSERFESSKSLII